jgi:hypothetical protein
VSIDTSSARMMTTFYDMIGKAKEIVVQHPFHELASILGVLTISFLSNSGGV